MDKFVIGVDIGGRSMKFGLFTIDGELIAKSSIITRTENEGNFILEDLVEHLEKIFEKYKLSKENLLGIGIGVPGPVVNKRKVTRAVNLNWDREVHIADYIEEKTGFRCLLANDANAAALGEQWKGAGKGLDSMVLLTLGTGVGGGIIIDGQILSGATGSGAEIGHMTFLEEDLHRECGCGGHRCFEQVASATGLEYICQDFLFDYDMESSLRDIDQPSAKDILDAGKNGDKLAYMICQEYFKHLARGLSILAAVVDPQRFVIGGGVSNAGDFLIDNVSRYFKEYAFPSVKNCQISIASLGNDAGIYGVAKLLID